MTMGSAEPGDQPTTKTRVSRWSRKQGRH
ncbi:hypothetical protein LINPERHAP1_LOCUS9647 [Linum perenne]